MLGMEQRDRTFLAGERPGPAPPWAAIGLSARRVMMKGPPPHPPLLTGRRPPAPCPSLSFSSIFAETGLLPKADADRIGQTVLAPREFDAYILDVPVTIYTQKNQEGKLPGTGVFPASGVAGPNPNPFGKNSSFSRPIRDGFKTVSDE